MSQYHTGVDGFKAILKFNGLIDGEPAVDKTGPGSMTQDPKTEDPSADDPTKLETNVVLHFRNPVGGDSGVVLITVAANADNPDTQDTVEEVDASFNVAEWIPPTQAKATSVSISTSAEPI